MPIGFPKELISILDIDIELENNGTEDLDNPINVEPIIKLYEILSWKIIVPAIAENGTCM